MKRILFYSFVIPLLIIVLVKIVSFISFPRANSVITTSLDVYSEPIQKDSIFSSFDLNIASYNLTITPKATLDISGLVVSTKKYHKGIDAKVVPIDIGLCWGEVAKPENYQKIKFEQYLRWLRYQIKEPLPFDMNYLNQHAGNIHIVPANKRLKKVLLSIRKGQKINLYGYLVEIKSKDPNRAYSRMSSLSRNDTGNGACEVLWVKQVITKNKLYN